MQLYTADYLADTAHLSTVEHGAYLLLIFNYWQRGESFKAKDERSLNKRLATVARLSEQDWEVVKEAIEEFFVTSETEWSHNRIERDLVLVNSKSAKASAAGRASANKRSTNDQQTLNERSTNVEQTLNHTDTDTDTDTDKEKEKEKKKEKPATAKKIDSSFSVTEEMRLWAAKEGYAGDIGKETESFVDFWLGEGVVKKDWVATWRNRIRKKIEVPQNIKSFNSAPVMLGGLNKRPL
jgi:uncharacterized protein YdaU (DUF1376 family)